MYFIIIYLYKIVYTYQIISSIYRPENVLDIIKTEAFNGQQKKIK